ncbi:MAG: hypothetical protein A2941_00315 [Candidatus Yanofskybacteria bacterium RIFCSPLOWO2_01_FULL_49_17]|uniref:Uncharacterized protein n=1 Tax=Candidatus Yanofskybacteria bacterium RIFCSPLOWO2_01_FULL_49_17 TaxID=1802700 RepID=A0A1F8GRK6_9BACT|nr:MAG: hypothetical protein A2941_00315 [Candidatus Yanofskybacteria bacterium RIFCSPLOWO2_01_FULL_49_17]
MFEQGPQVSGNEKKEKTYGSSLDELSNYLKVRNEEMRQARVEGKSLSFENLFKAGVDLYKGLEFAKKRGEDFKSIGKQTIDEIKSNPGSWEDIVTKAAANTQRVVASHVREGLEKKLEIKGETAQSLLDLEEEEQRLAAMRANIEAAEAAVEERKRILNQGQKFTTMDNTDSLKNEGRQAAAERREAGDISARDLLRGFFRRS